ncbi:MAG: hypothetical protein AAF267_09765, partial [Deinococcota bacterium]
IYGETGKAVLFSALTDAAVFGLFSLAYLSSVTQVMLASTLAVIITLITTLLMVPLTLRWLRPKLRSASLSTSQK